MLFEFNQPFFPFENGFLHAFWGFACLQSAKLIFLRFEKICGGRLGRTSVRMGEDQEWQKRRLLPTLFWSWMGKSICWPFRRSGDRHSVARGEFWSIDQKREHPLAPCNGAFFFGTAKKGENVTLLERVTETLLVSARNWKNGSDLREWIEWRE